LLGRGETPHVHAGLRVVLRMRTVLQWDGILREWVRGWGMVGGFGGEVEGEQRGDLTAGRSGGFNRGLQIRAPL
jgi:hypothetical protein